MAARELPELTNISVEYTCNGETTQEQARLQGVAALLVETRRTDALNAPVEVRFRPTPSSPVIHARGLIAAQLPGQGLRVEFTELAEADRRHLVELLYPPDRDRRAARRVLLASQIRTRVGGQQIVGYSRDVSVGGVYVETETPPVAGSEVTLRFKLKPEAEILECRAVVAYSVPEEGMGLRFLELPGSVRQAVEEFVGRREPED